jgi:hypothetical protein
VKGGEELGDVPKADPTTSKGVIKQVIAVLTRVEKTKGSAEDLRSQAVLQREKKWRNIRSMSPDSRM